MKNSPSTNPAFAVSPTAKSCCRVESDAAKVFLSLWLLPSLSLICTGEVAARQAKYPEMFASFGNFQHGRTVCKVFLHAKSRWMLCDNIQRLLIIGSD